VTTDAVAGLAAALLAAVLFGLGAVAQAHAVRRQDLTSGSFAGFVTSSVRDPWTMAVVGSYLVGFLLHAVSIWLLPLYLAQATIAMSLPVTALSSRLLRERLDARHWAAIGAVTVGLVALALGSGTAGEAVTDAWFAAALWAGVITLVVAARWSSRLGGGTLGTLAGLGYAGSAIAVRGVDTSFSAPVVIAALAVPVFGLLAFWTYSLGLERAPVSVATAPMIVGQTGVPAVVGLALLGDGLRDGWWPAALVGFAMSILGAIALNRDVRGPDASATPSSPGPAPRPGRRSRRSA
jgi:drug/metabolite transporter (DMT)-like permease